MASLFGTDGVRGVAGQWPLDRPTIARFGAALVRALHASHPIRIVVGRDTRESGPWIEQELARGAASEGARLTSVGIIPTPAIAYLAGTHDFDLGVVISASHNPYQDNGLKVFSGRGEKFGEAEESAVEAILADHTWTVAAVEPAMETANLTGEYLAHVHRLLPNAGALTGARIGVDLANGAATTTAPRLLRAIGLDVITIGDVPDGRNINRECGSTHPQHLRQLVLERGCRLGVAFDGDGDRAIFVDHRGQIVDGDAILLILATWLQDRGALAGNTVVSTVMSNLGLERALAARGIRMIRTPVGDKHVMDAMLKGGFVLGGEQSGHMILSEHLFTGDGLATALAVIRALADSGASLADLAGAMTPLPQLLVNVRVRDRRPVATVPQVAAAIARVECSLAGRGRLLVRYSGTEPLLRIMIEGDDARMIAEGAEDIAAAVRSSLGAEDV